MLLFVKNLAFTVLVPGTVGCYLPYSIGSRGTELGALSVLGPGRLMLAAPAFLVGTVVYLWCLWDFAVTGRGTPAPIDPPQQLVVRGLYRSVRNPMYFGVLTVLAGWVLLFRSRAVLEYALAVAAMFHLVVVFVEEPQLRRPFGPAYEADCRRVRRWLPGAPVRETPPAP